MDHNFHKHSILCQISKSMVHFCASSHHQDILLFLKVDNEKVGRGHGLQFSNDTITWKI